jgi:hypothetical protein
MAGLTNFWQSNYSKNLITIIHWAQLKGKFIKNQEVLGRINRLLSFIRHGPHRKWLVQQFFYCCICICYGGNVFIDPLPSNDRGIFTEQLPSNNRGIYIQTLRPDGMDLWSTPLRWALVPRYTYQVS